MGEEATPGAGAAADRFAPAVEHRGDGEVAATLVVARSRPSSQSTESSTGSAVSGRLEAWSTSESVMSPARHPRDARRRERRRRRHRRRLHRRRVDARELRDEERRHHLVEHDPVVVEVGPDAGREGAPRGETPSFSSSVFSVTDSVAMLDPVRERA